MLALVRARAAVRGVTEVPQTPTPAPPAAITPEPTPTAAAPQGEPETPGATPTPTPTPDADAAVPAADLAEWPQDRTAWTVILNSSGTREDAERLAGELAREGVPNVGVLDSNDFESLGPDSFIVFTGQYENQQEAEEALGPVPRPGRRRLHAPDRAEEGVVP